MRSNAGIVAVVTAAACIIGCGAQVAVHVAPEAPRPEPSPNAETAVTSVRGVSDESEPNNDPKTANAAAFGRPITMRIDPKGDIDWFKVNPQKQGYVSVRAKDVPSSLGMVVRYCTHDEWKGEQEIRGWRKLPDACPVGPGACYVQIGDDWNDAASPDAFSILIDFVDEMDATEPGNNAFKTAPAVALGDTQCPATYPVGDVDTFRVKVVAPGYLDVQAKDVPDGLGLQVRVCTFDEWKGEQEVRGWRKAPDACQVGPGEYFVQIGDDWNDAASPRAFPLRIAFREEMDATEPANNTPAAAPAIALGSTVNPAIFPVGDTDWFKVEVEKRGYLSVQARDVPDGIAPEIRVCTLTGAEPKELRGWRKLPDACRVEPGAYYVELHDDWNDAASPQTFPLLVGFIEEMDAAEPNDARPSAKQLAPGQTVSVAIFPVGDVDIYSVSRPKAGTIKVQAAGVPEGLGLQASVAAAREDSPDELRDIHGWTGLPATFTLDAGRTYYLRLADDWNDAASSTPFSVRFNAFDEQGRPMSAEAETPSQPDATTAVVPDVVGKPFPQAASEISGAGLRPAQQPSPQTVSATVTAQSPAAGERVRRRTPVSMTLAQVVPDLVGKPESVARMLLSRFGLGARVIQQPGGSPVPIVVSQDPAAGAKITVGGTVTVTVRK
jgi:hypothetical protein